MTDLPRTRVVVAVLTYRGLEATRACLRTIAASSSWPLPVLVLDNASATGEGTLLEREFGAPVTSLTTPTNGGVPGGYNAALRWAMDRDASHVLLLNNDTLLDDPNLIRSLTEVTKPDVAAVGPWVRSGAGAVQSAGGRVGRWTGRARLIPEARTPSRSAPYAVDWVDGCCVLVSLDAVRAIGGLDPEFFLYWEEVDWCARAKAAGYRLLIDPRASITHLGSLTVTGDQQLRYWMRNKVLFARRNGGRVANLGAVLSLLLVALPRHAVARIRSRRSLRLVLAAAARALEWNIRDARRRGGWRVPPNRA